MKFIKIGFSQFMKEIDKGRIVIYSSSIVLNNGVSIQHILETIERFLNNYRCDVPFVDDKLEGVAEIRKLFTGIRVFTNYKNRTGVFIPFNCIVGKYENLYISLNIASPVDVVKIDVIEII